MGSRVRRRVSVILGMLALALASFCPAQSLASHVRCGDTITADTTLDDDLLDCPDNGIEIGADDVTLDLNGHTISGTGTGMGIRNLTFHRVKLEDGVIAGFRWGVYLLGTIDNRLSSLTVRANQSEGIRLMDLVTLPSSDNRIEGSQISGNSDRGIVLSASSGNRIQENVVAGNGEGIVLSTSSGNSIEENVVTANDEEGMQLTDSSGNQIEANSVSDNGQRNLGRRVGIALSSSHDNSVTANSVARNLSGITLERSSANRVNRNLLEDDSLSIDLEDSDGNRVQGNRIFRREGLGFRGIGVLRSDANLIAGNSLFAQDQALLIAGTRNRAVRNNLKDTRFDGIAVSGSSNRIERNHVSTTLYSGPAPFVGISGIDLQSAHGTLVVNNSVSGYYEAMRLNDSRDNLIKKNRLFGGPDLEGRAGHPVMGIFVFASSERNRIEENVVSATGYGVYAVNNDTRVERNVLTRNLTGVYIDRDSTGSLIAGNVAARNSVEGITTSGPGTLITRNVASGNGTFGILAYYGPGTVIERNVASRNGITGIEILNAQITVSRNTANRNGDLGIEAPWGAIDGGGNTARGNGNPLQCLNVVCR